MPIYNYCVKVFENVSSLFDSLEETPTLLDFFESYVSYNNDNYFYLFGDKKWAVTKSFKESFETEDIYFDDDEFDEISNELINIFK